MLELDLYFFRLSYCNKWADLRERLSGLFEPSLSALRLAGRSAQRLASSESATRA